MPTKKKPALRLRVGGVYADATGRKRKMTKAMVLMSGSGNLWREDGTSYSGAEPDLIREVSAPKPATARKAAKPVMAWAYKNQRGQLGMPMYRKPPAMFAPIGCSIVRVKIVEVRR